MRRMNNSALHSKYIIDGVPQELTPAQLLGSVCDVPSEPVEGELVGKIVDETLEPKLTGVELDSSKIDKYLSSLIRTNRRVPLMFADSYTRAKIENALIDCISRMGSFRLGDLEIAAEWEWNNSEIGSMSAFYASVNAAAELLDALGIKLSEYSFKYTDGHSRLDFSVDLRQDEPDELIERPYTSESPKMGAASLPTTLCNDPKSWIVYVPFDSSSYRLGGSLLSQAAKLDAQTAPAVNDPDYFIDCYEVIRELVEDGIILAASSVKDGGLLKALKGMTSSKIGADIDLSDLRASTGEDDIVRLLFAEVPGALIQIRDLDFDYMDAELLLQDVAFYPLGHPVPGNGSVRVKASAKTGIQNILDSLLMYQGGEGED